MTQEHQATPAQADSGKQDGEPDVTQAHDQWLPEGHNVNQVQDEPFPASHQDDGRPEPDEDSPAPGAGRAPAPGAARPAGGTR
jgi:hypothetical protein